MELTKFELDQNPAFVALTREETSHLIGGEVKYELNFKFDTKTNTDGKTEATAGVSFSIKW